jgi:hypothetical protein
MAAPHAALVERQRAGGLQIMVIHLCASNGKEEQQ